MSHLSDLSTRLRAELSGNILPFWMTHVPDRERGGFHGAISNTLEIDPHAPRAAILQAFAIYGLSEYYRATQHPESKALACRLFELLEMHAFDPVYGGYIEGCAREWGPLEDMRLSVHDLNSRKSMNTLLHILEAYTNLLRIWDDPRLKSQHRTLLETFAQKVYDAQTGHLRLFFDDAWNSLRPLDSYGHDIEASWLMWEAAQMHPYPALHERIRPAVLGLAETVYREGRDSDGSLFDEGYAGQIHDDSKAWWPQAEALVGFTNAFQLTGDPKFAAAEGDVWRFIENYLIDRTHGDWFKQTDRAGTPDSTRMKAGIWDCPYRQNNNPLEGALLGWLAGCAHPIAEFLSPPAGSDWLIVLEVL